MRKQFETIDDYIKTFPTDVQNILGKIRQIIRKAAPEAVEAISYQMPTFKLNGKNLVHFAALRARITRYPQALKHSGENYRRINRVKALCSFR